MSEQDKFEQNDKAKEKQQAKPKDKKPFFLIRFGKWIGRKIRDLIMELKKVTWPKAPKVIKQTGIVLGVVAFFLVVIFIIDLGLAQLYSLLIRALGGGS